MNAILDRARQILRGLQYLHSMQPAITHGDLRCDKIYVNGHSGEIKIGGESVQERAVNGESNLMPSGALADLGLATLIPLRWTEAGPHNPLNPPPLESSSDIFAFGLCILELLTLKQLDPQHCSQWPELVSALADEEAKVFVSKCLSSESRPDASELLEDPFLVIKKEQAKSGTESLNESMQRSTMQQTLQEAIAAATQADKRSAADEASVSAGDEIGSGPIAVGKLRGEDYVFEFHGKVRSCRIW